MKYARIIVLIPVIAFVFAISPAPSLAATQPETQTQYISLLQQLLTLLEQELATIEANNSQPVSTAAATQITNPAATYTQAATSTPFQLYELTFEPTNAVNPPSSPADIYFWGSEQLEPSSIQIGTPSGSGKSILNTLPITFTVSSTMAMSAGSCIGSGASINGIKDCGGQMMRLAPSTPLTSGNYLMTFTTVSGQSGSGTFSVQ